jgi:hypothetical protein
MPLITVETDVPAGKICYGNSKEWKGRCWHYSDYQICTIFKDDDGCYARIINYEKCSACLKACGEE